MPGIGVTSSPQPSQAYPVQPNPNMPGYSNMQGSQAGFQNMPGGQAGFTTAPGGTPSVPPMISDILTRPNPAGYAAVLRAQQQQQGGSPGMTGPGMTGATIGAGLAAGGNGMAGIASAAESDGIMVYNDRTAYNEWEFIFDPSKVPAIPPVPGGGMGGTPASKMGTPASQLNPSAGFGAGMGTPGAAGGPAGMRMGGDFSALGAGGAQGATGAAGGIAGMQMGQANGVAGMQMGITGMNSTGLPAGFRPGRP